MGVGLATLFLVATVPTRTTAEATRATSLAHAPVETDVVLLALQLEHSILNEALTSFPAEGGLSVPLGAVCRALSLAIEVEAARGTADGFVIQQKRRFHLEARAGRVTIEGRSKTFDPARIQIRDQDLYVPARLLGEWLPLDFEIDEFAAVLRVVPREPLPLQLRLQRQRAIVKNLAQRRRTPPSQPDLRPPHHFLSMPFVDQNVLVSFEPEAQRRTATSTQHWTRATADLLWMEAGLSIIGDDRDALADVRPSLSRRDPDGHLLGPLGAREVTFGDVTYPGSDLLALPYSGPGFLLSSFPLQRQSQYDRHTFRGELPPDWEVELYRDGQLIGYQPSHSDGLYEFESVPLLFGFNLFRLVFYGPQGQRRDETHEFNIGASMTPAGKVHYRLAANDPRGARERGLAEIDVGLGTHLSASLAAVGMNLEDGRHEYGKIGLRAFRRRFFMNADAAMDRNGGSIAAVGLQTRLGGLGISVQHAELDEFRSELYRTFARPIRSRTSARLDGSIPLPYLRLSTIVDARHDRALSGERANYIAHRVSCYARGLAISNHIDWRFSGGTAGHDDRALGSLLVSKYLPRVALRGELGYHVRPERDLTETAATIEARLGWSYHLAFGARRRLATQAMQYTASLSKREGAFGFGLRAGFDRNRTIVGVTLSCGLNRDPGSGRWHSQARAVSGSGAASVQAFLDGNANGVADPSEKRLEGVTFTVDGARNSAHTDRDGTAFLRNLPAHQFTQVGIATATLEDPLWIAAKDQICLVPRPGNVARILFPVLVSGEVSGTVRLAQDGGPRAAHGVDLELVESRSAQVSKRTRTEYDGFYDIAAIPPGRYILRVASESVNRLHLQPQHARELEIAPNGTILENIDLLLEVSPSWASARP